MPVVLYHTVSDDHLPHVRHLYRYRPVNKFIKDLDFLATHFRFITLDSLINSLNGGERLPDNPLLLTFDDGFREMYDTVLPILLQKGIPAAFFLIAASLDNRALPFRNKASVLVDYLDKNRGNGSKHKAAASFLEEKGHRSVDYRTGILSIEYNDRNVLDELAHFLDLNLGDYLQKQRPFLTTQQVKEMIGKGFATGAHSVDHPNFAHLTEEERMQQVSGCLDYLSEMTVLTHRAFAFPFHSNMVNNEFLVKLSRQSQVEVTFGTNGLVNENKHRHFQRFHMDFNRGPVRNHLAAYYLKGSIKDLLNK